VNDERTCAETVINDINHSVGKKDGFQIELLRWETSTYPGLGEDGQDVINQQIGDDYNIFVGIMWKKFGTKTNRAGSGTEEEFNRAYQQYNEKKSIQIMFYFRTDHICPK
jgi:hypothetical protein